MAFVGFSRQCEHKTAFKLPAHRNFCPVPIRSAPVCTTTSIRGSVNKLPTSLQKAIRGGKRPTFMHVSSLRVLCLCQGKDQKCHRFKGSTAQVRCWHPGLHSSVCVLHHRKLPVSRCVLENTNRRAFGQGSLHPKCDLISALQ